MAGPKATTQYEEIRARVDQGETVGDAIKHVAAAHGVNAESMRTSYYRMRREVGEVPTRRIRVTSRIKQSETPSEELVRRAMEAVAALAALAQRNESLEKDSEQLQRLKQSLTE